MASRSLKDLIRRVLSGGVALGGAAQSLPAMPPSTPHSPPDETAFQSATLASRPTDVVVRRARPKILLRAMDATRVALISSHRSHRSHSSHYSSSRGGGGGSPSPAPPKPKPAKTESGESSRGGSSPQALGLMGGEADSNTLGKRVLRRGMRGKDVDQLIILLVKGNLLSAADIPQESLFTAEVEVAVKTFQKSKGITADGAVDYRTLLLLRVQ